MTETDLELAPATPARLRQSTGSPASSRLGAPPALPPRRAPGPAPRGACGRDPGAQDALSVLVVDDNPGDVLLVEELLHEADDTFEVHGVGSLREAERWLDLRTPDVVVLDLGLPESQGIETIVQLLEFESRVAIVVMTGLDSEIVGNRAVELGAQDYLAKGSLDGRRLAERLRYAHERHRLLQKVEQLAADSQTSEASRRKLVDTLSDGVCVVGENHRVLFLNPAARRMLGAELLESRFPVDFTMGEKAEIDLLEPDGRTRHVVLQASQLDWNGQPAAVVSLHDITDRKQADQLREQLIHADRLAALGQLAASVGHEITNPAAFMFANTDYVLESIERLHGMTRLLEELAQPQAPDAGGIAELLAQHRPTAVLEEIRELIEENRDGMQRIQSIVKDLRTFARIDENAWDTVDLNEVVHTASRMVRNEIRHRARLLLDLDEVPTVHGEQGKLVQVVTNLLVNAAHAIQEGEAEANEIRVTTRCTEDRVLVRVSDTGSGVPQELRGRIFEPFFTTKPREQGTGLGLSLCAQIAQTHGGKLSLGERSQGSCFELSLPIGRAQRLPKSSHPPCPAVRRLRLLVVDDEPSLLRAYTRMLRGQHDVVTAKDGREALDLLDSDADFDAVLCDLMMPDVDGPMFFERMCERHPELSDRVLFSSGGAFTARGREFVASLPPGRLLDKPISRALLLAAVAGVASGSSER